jgi:hypothetical protein
MRVLAEIDWAILRVKEKVVEAMLQPEENGWSSQPEEELLKDFKFSFVFLPEDVS